METNIIKYYGFLTRDEFEKYNCYKIAFDHLASEPLAEKEYGLTSKWKIETIPNAYPKSLIHAKIELRRRGLDPGDEDYGLARVLEAGDVTPRDGMWSRDDIDLAMISLAELGVYRTVGTGLQGVQHPTGEVCRSDADGYRTEY